MKEFVLVDEKTGKIEFKDDADFSEFENAAEKIYEKNLNEIFDPRQKSEFISQKENFISATTLFLFLRETFTDEIEKARKSGMEISDENLQLLENIEGFGWRLSFENQNQVVNWTKMFLEFLVSGAAVGVIFKAFRAFRAARSLKNAKLSVNSTYNKKIAAIDKEITNLQN